MVFIDGGHTEEAARADYEGWTPYLLPGGLLPLGMKLAYDRGRKYRDYARAAIAVGPAPEFMHPQTAVGQQFRVGKALPFPHFVRRVQVPVGHADAAMRIFAGNQRSQVHAIAFVEGPLLPVLLVIAEFEARLHIAEARNVASGVTLNIKQDHGKGIFISGVSRAGAV